MAAPKHTGVPANLRFTPNSGHWNSVSKFQKRTLDNSLDNDDTFIEEQEEVDADVTDIIGGDIENKEEG